MTRNMYTVAGDGPCNEELALRIQAGDKNAAERLIAQNEGYLTKLARAYTPWCELEDLKHTPWCVRPRQFGEVSLVL